MRQDGLDRLEDLGRKRRGREEEGGYEKSRRWPFYRAHSLSPSTKCFGLHGFTSASTIACKIL